jgi:hypothetical protein
MNVCVILEFIFYSYPHRLPHPFMLRFPLLLFQLSLANLFSSFLSSYFLVCFLLICLANVITRIHPVSLIKKTAWPEYASELYRPSDRSLSAKLVPTFGDRWCHVVSVTDPHGCILEFLYRTVSLILIQNKISD